MKKIILMSAVIALLCPATSAKARDVKMSGGLSTGYDYFDRQYKETTEDGTTTTALTNESRDDADDYEKIFVRPMIMLEALSEKDSLLLRYEPSFYYDNINDENDVNHSASLAVSKLLTNKWQLQLSDRYEIRDDAEQLDSATDYTTTVDPQRASTVDSADEGNPDQLSTNLGRRRYTTNNLQLLSEYTYREDSTFSLGYSNSLLRNDDNIDLSNQDYDKHDALFAIGHRWNNIWKMNFEGHYIRGLFDIPALDDPENAAAVAAIETAIDQNVRSTDPADDLSDDVTEYNAAVGLNYLAIPRQPLSLEYSLASYDYDSDLQDDTDIHNLTLGWQWQYTPHLSFNAGAGPSYVVTDNQDDTWGYNGNLGTRYQLERSIFSLDVQKALERQNFTGQTIDNGLIDYWDARASFSYKLLASTTVSLFAGYRYEDQDELTLANIVATQSASSSLQADAAQLEEINTKRFTTGCSLTYAFWQWYALDLSYNYADQISDRPDDEYDEHQVMLTLSFAKELFHW